MENWKPVPGYEGCYEVSDRGSVRSLDRVARDGKRLRGQAIAPWQMPSGHLRVGLGHPTAKPLPMVQDMIRKFSNRGDTVLDPFAGSGTTLRAAVNEGRKAIGIELDERYCEVIAKRLAQGVLDFEGMGA